MAKNKKLQMLQTRAEGCARRLDLAAAIQAGRGMSTLAAVRTVCSELDSLASELKAAGLPPVAEACEATLRVLTGLPEVANAREAIYGGRHIAVLDHMEVTRDLVALALSSAGCVVSAFGSLAEMLEQFSRSAPECVVLEPAHPDLKDGMAHAQLLDALKGELIPVILFSEHPRAALADAASLYEADACLGKEHGLGELRAQVDHVLSSIVW